MEGGCPGLEKWQMPVPLVENEWCSLSGVSIEHIEVCTGSRKQDGKNNE